MHFLFDLVLLVTFSKTTTGYNYWILSLFVTVIISIYIQQKNRKYFTWLNVILKHVAEECTFC